MKAESSKLEKAALICSWQFNLFTYAYTSCCLKALIRIVVATKDNKAL